MDGNTLIEIIQTSSPIIQSSVSAIVGAIMTTLFLKRNTEKEEFEKIKAGQFKEVTNTLLEQGKMTYYEYYKCNNFLEIAKLADELSDESNEKNEYQKNTDFDFDWFIRFFDAASSISNENMQELWAKILKGEIKHHRKFSLRAIETMRNMSQFEAELFAKVSKIVFDDGNIFSLLDDVGQEVVEKYGFDNGVLRILEECGIINGLKIDSIIELDPNEMTGFELYGYLLLLKNITNDKITLHYSGFSLTMVGSELFSVVINLDDNTHYDYLIDLGNLIQSKFDTLDVAIHPILDVDEENDIINYNNEINLLKL